MQPLQPQSFSVAVLFEKHPSVTQWTDANWRAMGLVVNSSEAGELRFIQQRDSIEQYIYGGLQVKLFKDQCESYYHNLVSDTPKCYVIATTNPDGSPKPFLVTLSFDEASAYLECDDEVFDMPIPPELYLWLEAFMLDNYFPEKKYKRKRKKWHQSGSNQNPANMQDPTQGKSS